MTDDLKREYDDVSHCGELPFANGNGSSKIETFCYDNSSFIR